VQNSQQAAAATVQSVLSGQNLNIALDTVLRSVSLADGERAAARAFSYGTLRHLGYLRFALGRLASRPPKDPSLRCLLLVALYQLEFGHAAHYAVVDQAVESVSAVCGRPLKSFANAVLRAYLRKRQEIADAAIQDDVARFSYPRWWIDKLRSQLGGQADEILEYGNLHPPMTLRVNRRRIEPADYLALLADNGLSATLVDAALVDSALINSAAIRLETPMSVEKLPGFAAGMVSVQDAGAQLSAPLLDLQAGQTVVDSCAAPGGKTGHILELADVSLTALDKDSQRLERVGENLGRLGYDAQMQCADAADLDTWWDGKPVDRVLLDAPCSASGVVRRHPDIKWLRREKDIRGFARQQGRLLDAMWKVVVGGGKLLYVTCSVFREENQDQVERFLARHANACLLARAANSDGGLLLPAEDHDGFYHALFQKV
jgi:16S rRNA (cytosine967-C5)-methyltransferase